MGIDGSTRLNRIKGLLQAGKPSFGIIATVPGVQVVQVLASAGFDWVMQQAGQKLLEDVRR